jgi:hypothetical protein
MQASNECLSTSKMEQGRLAVTGGPPIVHCSYSVLFSRKISAYHLQRVATCVYRPQTLIVTKVIGRPVPRNNCLRCLFIFTSPLQVTALAGHLQAKYTIIFGKLPHYNGHLQARAETCSGEININKHLK